MELEIDNICNKLNSNIILNSDIHVKKHKCKDCSRKRMFKLKCNSCEMYFCTRCLMPENHNCINLESYLIKCKESLRCKLNTESCKSEKIIKI
jgi:predicted nucleic acid binding AN1-type Zn finger protein